MHAGHCVQQQQQRQRGVTRGSKSRSTPAPTLFCRQRRRVAAAAHPQTAADFYEPPSAVLICPGFLDGYDGRTCTELKANLEAYFAAEQQKRRQLGSLDTGAGTAAAAAAPPPPPPPIVEVLRVRGSDWWPTLRGGSFGFYVDALADAVGALRKRALAAAARDSGGGGDSSSGGSAALPPSSSPKPPTVALVALSAAGWVARLALGPRRYEGRECNLAASGAVTTLVTLGTPHDSLEAYPFGRAPERLIGDGDGEGSGGGSGSGSDALPAFAAASSLRLANHYYPDAAALAPARLVCVCGSGVRGTPLSAAALFGGGGSGVGGIEAWLAGVSYKATCGQVEADGDGVTPLDAAFVRGAAQVVLPGVRHGPGRGGSSGTKWYGSASVVPLWAPYLTAAAAAARE
jgi:hypothetical protein